MRNGLEEFINRNRDEFDLERPDRSIWLEIERDLDRKSNKEKVFKFGLLKIAASFIFVLGVGFLIGVNSYSYDEDELNYTITPELKQFRETEAYYKTQVNLKLNEVKRSGSKSNVENDLKMLDEIYNQLKSEMMNSEYTNSSMMIDMMIKNYKTKVEILENILNKQKQIKNESEII
jgi:hypothetical protein